MILEPVTVRPKVAFDALGVGFTKGYELINSGDLEAIKIGRATRANPAFARASTSGFSPIPLKQYPTD